MTPAGDSFQAWLDGFRKEVDAIVVSASERPDAAIEARTAFDNWWQATQEPVTGAATEAGPVEEISRRVNSLLYENAMLEKKLETAGRATEALKGIEADKQAAVAEARVQASRERETLEARIGQLETQQSTAQEQLRSLNLDKRYLEEALDRGGLDRLRVDEDLRLERDRMLLANTEILALKQKLAECYAELPRLRETLASRDGTLEELRRQAGVYQERLIHAKELTDADVALLRQELRLYLEEMRVMMNTIRQGEQR